MSGAHRLCISLEDFLLSPVRAQFRAGAEFSLQAVNGAAVRASRTPLGDHLRSFDVLGQRRSPPLGVLLICGGDPVAFGLVPGHPCEGSGKIGGGGGLVERLSFCWWSSTIRASSAARR